jgi:hypothetical protein
MTMQHRTPHVSAIRRFLPAVFAAAIAAGGIAQVDPCGGNGGGFDASLGLPVLGGNVPFALTGPPGGAYFFALSDAAPQLAVPPYGTACLDFTSPSFLVAFSGVLPANGVFALSLAVPAGPPFDTLAIFGQGGVQNPAASGGFGISPLVRFDFAAADSFESGGATANAVNFAASVPIGGGRVFVCGGKDGDLLQTASGPFASTALWSRTQRAAIPGPSLLAARFAHTATRLADGRVLIVGGAGGAPGFLAHTSCEIYDPTTGTITPAAPLAHPRAGHAAHLLPDGRVLVAGGCANLAVALFAAPSMNAFATARDDAELYDPTTDTWSGAAGVMQAPRVFGGSTTLADGKVVLVSGICGVFPIAGTFPALVAPTGSVFTDLFDPATNLFTPLPAITGTPLAAPQLVRLLDGRLWLTGGAGVAGVLENPSATVVTRIFDGVQWSAGPNLPVPVAHHRAELLANGSVHVSGGCNRLFQDQATTVAATACSLFDGVMLTPATPLPVGRAAHAIAALEDGALLFAGGRLLPATIAPPSPAVDVTTYALYTPAP